MVSAAPVKAPRTCPNSSLSDSVSTTAEQLTVMNRLRAARTELVQGTNGQLLPGPGLARHEGRARVWCQPADQREDVLHDGRAADHPAELESLRHLPFEIEQRATPLGVAAHGCQQLAQSRNDRKAL